MVGLAVAFLLGFAFGVASLVVFRHEIQLTSQVGVLSVLFLVGLLLGTVLLFWFRRISRKIRLVRRTPDFTLEEEWVVFLGVSLLLFISYLVLVLVIAFL